jgi:hypothetical protein
LVQQHAQTFFAEVEAAAGASLPRFAMTSYNKLLAFSRKRPGSAPWGVARPH